MASAVTLNGAYSYTDFPPLVTHHVQPKDYNTWVNELALELSRSLQADVRQFYSTPLMFTYEYDAMVNMLGNIFSKLFQLPSVDDTFKSSKLAFEGWSSNHKAWLKAGNDLPSQYSAPIVPIEAPERNMNCTCFFEELAPHHRELFHDVAQFVIKALQPPAPTTVAEVPEQQPEAQAQTQPSA